MNAGGTWIEASESAVTTIAASEVIGADARALAAIATVVTCCGFDVSLEPKPAFPGAVAVTATGRRQRRRRRRGGVRASYTSCWSYLLKLGTLT